jgi:hypothetical protein
MSIVKSECSRRSAVAFFRAAKIRELRFGQGAGKTAFNKLFRVKIKNAGSLATAKA